MDACIVGEPTSELHVGDTIKNGRRGSLNLLIHAIGQQGHVAYPAKSRNALAGLLDFLQILREHPIDDGAEGFDPSHFEVTAVETGNPTHNVIPARASARANIRFNTRHTREGLIARIERAVQRFHEVSPVRLELTFSGSGEAFYSPPGRLSTILAQACAAETGRPARLSTSGGTSDARFIHAICPVAELGLRNETAHKVDEHVTLADLDTLTRIYVRAIGAFFA
jgi:succinyl-diaminopimelate desuccinylase